MAWSVCLMHHVEHCLAIAAWLPALLNMFSKRKSRHRVGLNIAEIKEKALISPRNNLCVGLHSNSLISATPANKHVVLTTDKAFCTWKQIQQLPAVTAQCRSIQMQEKRCMKGWLLIKLTPKSVVGPPFIFSARGV